MAENQLRASPGAVLFLLLLVSHCCSPSLQRAQKVHSPEGAPVPAPSGSDGLSEGKEKVAPKYELVLARYQEQIGWISRIPDFWRITVYNKGGANNEVKPVQDRPFTVINLPNAGRESESYMHHIVLRWETLADYTVFGQAWPFIHSKYFVDLLKNPGMLQPVQCMSLVYTEQGHEHNITPKEVVEAYRKHPWYRSERLSLRTLDSIYFNDVGAANIGRQYLAMHGLPPGTNIIAHHFEMIGLRDWVPKEREIGSFAYGGHVGVERSKILQHPIAAYESFRASMMASDVHTYVAERMWLCLWGGPDFQDR